MSNTSCVRAISLCGIITTASSIAANIATQARRILVERAITGSGPR
jgi:hypothetical protein